MTADVERLKKELAALDVADQMAIFHFLEDTLPDVALNENPAAVSEEWQAELHRRAEDIVNGRVSLVPSEQVVEELRARLP